MIDGIKRTNLEYESRRILIIQRGFDRFESLKLQLRLIRLDCN